MALTLSQACGASALDAIQSANERVQQAADLTQDFCKSEKALRESQGLDTADLVKYCEKIWASFKAYADAIDLVQGEQ